ncbi:hypothetical protein M758_11G102400 [Ceratodon purpureus]|nr:hypothetical protein M758_11G102400 [Ceratodon purpureus]KAG0601336.1 hypothetical protein M758_11G102400 [Ceratodon purpureus]
MGFSGAPRLMIVSDLDNTMVDHKDKNYTSLLRFGALWQADYNHDSLLVYSTGRSPALYAELRSEVPLITPGITIMSVGTEIRYGDTMAPDLGWEEELNQGWDRDAIVEEGKKLDLKFQVESEQRPHKVSFYVEKDKAEEVIKTLTEKFKERQLNAKIIYSGGLDLDVLPTGAGKGQALAYLMKKLKAEGRAPGHTLVCGDSGNDAELFTVPDVYGVIVGNAMEELLKWHSEHSGDKSHIYLAKERCAAGILEAMQHFDLQPNVSPRDQSRSIGTVGEASQMTASTVAHKVVDYLLLMENWLKGGVDKSDTVFSRLKSSLAPDASYVHAFGIITNPYEEIDTIRELHGVMKEKPFCMWVDRVRVEKMSDTTYLARFDKWEKLGELFSNKLLAILVLWT